MVHPYRFLLRDHKSYRDLLIISVLTFIFGIIYGLFSFYLPIFVDGAVKNIALVGVFLAIVEIMGIFVDLPFGAFADRYGRRRTIFLGAILLGFAALFFQFSGFSIIVIALALAFYGVVIELVLIPGDAELMSLSPRMRSGRFFGIYESAHNFGYAVGPFLGGFLIWYSPSPVFWALIVLSALLGAWAFFFKNKKSEAGEPLIQAAQSVIKRDHYLVSSIREFRLLGFRGWMMLIFFFTFAFRWGAIALLEPLFALDLNLHPVWVGLIYSASTLPFIFFSAPAGYFSDKYGVKPFIVGGLLISGIATFLFGSFDGALILFVLSFVAAIGDSLLVPTVYAAFDTLASRHFKGRVTSVVAMAEDAGYFFGPLVAGSIAYYFGFPAAFYTFGILILLVAVLAIFVKLR